MILYLYSLLSFLFLVRSHHVFQKNMKNKGGSLLMTLTRQLTGKTQGFHLDNLTKWNVPCTEEEVVQRLKETPAAYQNYLSMKPEWKSRFLDFCIGKKTMPLTYDPFFKEIFHPDIHPDRLSRLISSLLGFPVRVKQILPSEDIWMCEENPLVMEFIVELEDGSLANVEIQKVPYRFLGERISCYSSDHLRREYSRLKGMLGKNFTFYDMKKVYTIVLYEQSLQVFQGIPGEYRHYGKTEFSSGLKQEFLQEYCLIALDVFREMMCSDGKICVKSDVSEEERERIGWLLLLTTETVEEAEQVVKEYPWLEEIYQEAASYRQRLEETLLMYSEVLRKQDRNEARYRIEELEEYQET